MLPEGFCDFSNEQDRTALLFILDSRFLAFNVNTGIQSTDVRINVAKRRSCDNAMNVKKHQTFFIGLVIIGGLSSTEMIAGPASAPKSPVHHLDFGNFKNFWLGIGINTIAFQVAAPIGRQSLRPLSLRKSHSRHHLAEKTSQ